MATKARMFGSIAKVEDLDDGTVMVEGIASAPTPDSDGETFTTECMKAAIPDYMENRRALREMHQPIAAGVTKALWVDDEGVTRIRAHVVDPVSVKKVQTGVLKMFSIEGVIPPGGRDAVDRKIVHKLKLREVSLVDVGAHPDAMIEVVKLDKPNEEEAPMAKKTDTAAPAADPQTQQVDDQTQKGDATQKMEGSSMLDAMVALCRECAAKCIECAKACLDCIVDSPATAWICRACAETCASCAQACIACAQECSPAQKAEMAEALGPALQELRDVIFKAGARFSGDTKKALAEAHDMIRKADMAMKGLGYDADGDGDGDGDGKAKKVAAAHDGEDLVAKAAGLTDQVAKLEGEKADLVAKVDGLTAEKEQLAAELDKAEKGLASVVDQMKAKGMLRTVDKAADDPGTVKKSSTPSGGEAEPSNDPLDAIRKVHATGGVKINPSAR